MTDIYAQRRAEIIAQENLPHWPMTESEFKTVVGPMRARLIEYPPLSLKGVHIQDIYAAARHAFYPPGGYRIVYALVNMDRSVVRIGQGLPERLAIHTATYLINITPEYLSPRRKKNPGFWNIDKRVFDMIHVNGGFIEYIVLASGLTPQQSKAGEKAVVRLFPPGAVFC